MSSTNKMKEARVLCSIGSSQVVVILEGELRLYPIAESAIVKKMEKIGCLEVVTDWLAKKQEGQSICFLEQGTYFSDNMIINIGKGTVTFYTEWISCPKETYFSDNMIVEVGEGAVTLYTEWTSYPEWELAFLFNSNRFCKISWFIYIQAFFF